MRAWRVAATVGIAAAAALAAGGCITGVPHCCAITMPARYDVGVTSSDRATPGTHIAVGVSYASAVANPAPRGDVVFGWLLDLRGEDRLPAEKMASTPAIGPYVFGGFLEAAVRVGGGRHHRGFLGLRTEVVRTYLDEVRGGPYGFGLTGRFGWELDKVGQGSTWIGALAAGVFVEATARAYGGHAVEHTVVGGVSFRIPVKFVRTR